MQDSLVSVQPAESVFQPPQHKRPLVIAGPCSAETETQLRSIARSLSEQNIGILRAGFWKPRTRPDTFEGVGAAGFAWLASVRRATNMKIAAEVASPSMATAALKAGIDILWIGARTTVNPFLVQEIADALAGTQTPVIVKNPVNPDLGLWLGALERLGKAGLHDLAACHRGFSYFGQQRYRNIPHWEIPLELRRQHRELPLLCDPSHIGGERALIPEIAQKAMDLGFDGLMIETHPEPNQAKSDAGQQLTPDELRWLLQHLKIREPDSQDDHYRQELERLRTQIDEIDSQILEKIAKRMAVANEIGKHKAEHDVQYFQIDRWQEILETRQAEGSDRALSTEFIEQLLQLLHLEAIRRQSDSGNR